MNRLPESYFSGEAETVARSLLGQTIVVPGETTKRLRIVETEAYVGTHDLACHASKGRTKRTEVMFGPPGKLYIYLIYGMYDMLNIVTGPAGEAQAVLIRAGEPLQGIDGRTDGPGKLTRVLGVGRDLNGASASGERFWLEPGPPPKDIVVTSRVGVDYAQAWKDAALRFYDADSSHVSKKVR